jgi:membrane-bound metal-dependent hydrolase YbcI (DUF457 family)
MDFVTHAAVGGLVGRALTPPEPERREATRFAVAGAIAASLPDADHVLEWLSADAYLLHHRSATHSVFFLIAVVAAVALMPGAGRARRAGVTAAALASHLFLDLLTPFGTGILWPLIEARPSLDVLPIVAPFMVGLALAGLMYATARGWRSGGLGRRAARVALAGLLVFIGFEALVAWRGAAAVGASETLSLPHPNRPWQAVVFATEEDVVREYRVGLDGSTEELNATPRIEGDAAEIRALMQTRELAPYLARYRIPIAHVDGDHVVFEDLQYDHVSRDLEPTWLVAPRSGDGVVRAHLLVEGVQPLAWAGVVLVAWAAGRGWRKRVAMARTPEHRGKTG